MTDIYELFKKETWTPDDCTAYIWTKESVDELAFNKHQNVDDLMNHEGDTYSFNVHSEIERDGYIIFALQNDYGGESFQAIFDLSKKVDADKYWEDLDNEDEEE